MKNKIFITAASALAFAIAGSAYAVGQEGNSETGQSARTQTEQQTNLRLQDGTGSGNQMQNQNQIQNQNQVKNQGETSQIQTREQGGAQNANKSGSTASEQRMGRVASAVQEMLQMTDRNRGIGQQVRTMAQNQTQNHEKLEASLKKVQNRNGLAKFFIGPDYGELNNAKKMLEQNREQIKQLNQVKNQLANQGDQQTLTQQIQTLEQNNLEIENSLEAEKNVFSLFGWMFKTSSD